MPTPPSVILRTLEIPHDHAIELAPGRSGERRSLVAQIDISSGTGAVRIGLDWGMHPSAPAFRLSTDRGPTLARLPFGQRRVFARAIGDRAVSVVVAEEFEPSPSPL